MQTIFGFTYIELLFALLLFSLIILGVDATQLVAYKKTKTIYYTAVANQQINNLLERMRTEPNTIANFLPVWNQQNHAVLPNGHGNLSVDERTIEIKWGMVQQQTCKLTNTSGCLRIHWSP